MPLYYLVGSLAAVALLVLLNHVLFGRVQPSVGGADALAARLARDIPGFRAGRLVIGTDGRTALVENAADRTVLLVQALGDGLVTRKLSRESLTRVGRQDGRLSLELADFTLPRAALYLEGEACAREWEARLKA